MSAAAVFPLLLAVAQRRGSFMRALRRRHAGRRPAEPGDPPACRSGPCDGRVGSLVDRLADGRWAAAGCRDADPVRRSERLDRRAPDRPWVLAPPTAGRWRPTGWCWPCRPRPAADLLAPHDADAATLAADDRLRLGGRRHPRLPAPAVARRTWSGTGLLVPHGTPAPGRAEATTCWSPPAPTCRRKWPHLRPPGERAAAGLGRAVRRRTAGGPRRRRAGRPGGGRAGRLMLGVRRRAHRGHVVTRWPGLPPQYRVHHLLRVDRDRGGGDPAPGRGRGRRLLPGRRHPGLHRQRARRRPGRPPGTVGRTPGGGPRADGPRADGPRADGPGRTGPGRTGPRPDAAPGRGRRPVLGRRGAPRPLAPPLGLVAAGLRRGRPPLLAPGRPAGLRTRLLAGWVAGLGCFVPGLFWARDFNWYGAVVLMVVEALSMGAGGGAGAAGRGAGCRPSSAPSPCCEAVRMTWPFGGLPIGGVFLGQAGRPAARHGPPRRAPAAHRAGLGGRGRAGAVGDGPAGPGVGRRPG